MIIDSHMHISKLKYWDKEEMGKYDLAMPAKDTPIEKTVGWFKKAGVSKAIGMGQDMTRIWNSSIASNDYVFDVCNQYADFFIPLASIEPIDKYDKFNKSGYEYIKNAINDHGAKGVLMTPPYGHYSANDKTVYPFYNLCQEMGVIVQFHHSASADKAIIAPTKYANPYNLNDVIVDFPELKIVVEHLGYPFSEHLFVLMKNDNNLWTDLALLLSRPIWLTWNLVLAKEYGVIDRVMYASDYVADDFVPFSDKPVDDMKENFEFIRTGLNNTCKNSGWPVFTEKDIEGILWKNAARLYDLKI